MTIANRIREHIIANGIIFKKVAERAGIDEKRFYRLIGNKTGMLVEEYEAICTRGLGLSPSYFFNENISETENTKSA